MRLLAITLFTFTVSNTELEILSIEVSVAVDDYPVQISIFINFWVKEGKHIDCCATILRPIIDFCETNAIISTYLLLEVFSIVNTSKSAKMFDNKYQNPSKKKCNAAIVKILCVKRHWTF